MNKDNLCKLAALLNTVDPKKFVYNYWVPEPSLRAAMRAFDLSERDAQALFVDANRFIEGDPEPEDVMPKDMADLIWRYVETDGKCLECLGPFYNET